MTLADRYDNAKDHLILWAVIVSLVLHGILLAPWLGRFVERLEMMEAQAEPLWPWPLPPTSSPTWCA